MIGYLSGKVIAPLPNNQIIVKLPSGLGYVVNVSPNKRYHQNETVEFFIVDIRREDKEELYGFLVLQDREWMEKLMKVSGVGPKMAATIIYTLGFEKVMKAVANGKAEELTEVKGLGAKTAKKIVLELKGGMTDLDSLDRVDTNSQMSVNFTETLSNLGYKRGEIVAVITKLKKAKKWDDQNLMATIKEGLRLLSKK
jgi:Holliday junction DNA helicase RuvA